MHQKVFTLLELTQHLYRLLSWKVKGMGTILTTKLIFGIVLGQFVDVDEGNILQLFICPKLGFSLNSI